jgi:uncharacterized protein (TIGR02996 family)
MSLQAAFLADVAANPDDDAPRLICADWFEDHGDPNRAAFIRTQCRLAKVGRYDRERYELEGEEAALLKGHGQRWRKPLARITSRVVFRRGFPDVLSLPAAKFVSHGEEAFAAAPTLREYRVLQPAAAWEALLGCAALARVRSLDAGHHRLGLGRVQALAHSPQLAGLRELSLSSSAMRPAGVAALAASPYLANLRTLDLASSHVGDAAAERVAASPHWKQLTSLDLSGNDLTPAGIARLARWEGAARLEHLALEENEGDDAARAFASGEWPALRRLKLAFHHATPAGIEALGRCPSLAGVRDLDVPLWSRHLRALAEAPSLANLEALTVRGASDEGSLCALAGSALLGSLRSLSLYSPDPDGLAVLLAEPAAAGLRRLSLSAAGGGNRVAAVAAATHLVNLDSLVLNLARLGPEEARQLASAPHLAGLVELTLAGCHINESAARALIASPHLNGCEPSTSAATSCKQTRWRRWPSGLARPWWRGEGVLLRASSREAGEKRQG